MKVGNSIAALPPDVRKASGFPVRAFFVSGGYASGLREAEPRAKSLKSAAGKAEPNRTSGGRAANF
jgi:hypothetical protein